MPFDHKEVIYDGAWIKLRHMQRTPGAEPKLRPNVSRLIRKPMSATVVTNIRDALTNWLDNK